MSHAGWKMARLLAAGLLLSGCAEAQPHPRSRAARAEFQRRNPCPSTGQRRGPCPGHVVDHVRALACGGPDVPANMQWQTAAEGRAKDRVELTCEGNDGRP